MFDIESQSIIIPNKSLEPENEFDRNYYQIITTLSVIMLLSFALIIFVIFLISGESEFINSINRILLSQQPTLDQPAQIPLLMPPFDNVELKVAGWKSFWDSSLNVDMNGVMHFQLTASCAGLFGEKAFNYKIYAQQTDKFARQSTEDNNKIEMSVQNQKHNFVQIEIKFSNMNEAIFAMNKINKWIAVKYLSTQGIKISWDEINQQVSEYVDNKIFYHKVFINDKVVNPEQLWDNHHITNVHIVGAGPSGLFAALVMSLSMKRRFKTEITVFEKRNVNAPKRKYHVTVADEGVDMLINLIGDEYYFSKAKYGARMTLSGDMNIRIDKLMEGLKDLCALTDVKIHNATDYKDVHSINTKNTMIIVADGAQRGKFKIDKSELSRNTYFKESIQTLTTDKYPPQKYAATILVKQNCNPSEYYYKRGLGESYNGFYNPTRHVELWSNLADISDEPGFTASVSVELTEGIYNMFDADFKADTDDMKKFVDLSMNAEKALLKAGQFSNGNGGVSDKEVLSKMGRADARIWKYGLGCFSSDRFAIYDSYNNVFTAVIGDGAISSSPFTGAGVTNGFLHTWHLLEALLEFSGQEARMPTVVHKFTSLMNQVRYQYFGESREECNYLVYK